jgi:dihydrolipoamide dehydrogenase
MIDLVIIGGGPGGYELALEARKENLNVVLIEKDKLGGTCLNYGCIPTKSFFKNAQVYNDIKNAKEFGVNLDNLVLDFSMVKKRKDEVVASLNQQIEFALERAGVTVIKGEARLIDTHLVQVNGKIIDAKYVVIAIGSTSKDLNIEGSSLMIDSTDLLNLNELPKHLIIVGGGIIGVEFASIFNAFGVKVSILEYMDNILPTLDEEISKKMKLMLKKQGIDIYNGAKVTKVIENKGLKEVSYEVKDKPYTLCGDVILKAVGRVASLNSLNLSTIGIEVEKNFIKVDENFKTSVRNIYAIGDCNGKSLLAHSATYQGYYVLNHILGKESKINFSLTPSAVFSFPTIATIGLTELEAKNKNINYRVSKYFYKANGKANAMNETDGFIKVLIDEHNYIIGCHILGCEADTLIHEVMMMMNGKIKVDNAKDFIHAHPTLSEIVSSLLHIS